MLADKFNEMMSRVIKDKILCVICYFLLTFSINYEFFNIVILSLQLIEFNKEYYAFAKTHNSFIRDRQLTKERSEKIKFVSLNERDELIKPSSQNSPTSSH